MLQNGADPSALACARFSSFLTIFDLAFIHGAFLPDPEGLLEGEQIAKRFVKLTSYEQVPWDAIQNLIDASSRFDPYTQTFRQPKLS